MPPRPQPLLHPQLQLLLQLLTRLFPMNKIAKTPSHTSLPTVQPTTRFPEVCDGGELAVDGARGVPTRVERVAGGLRAVFVFEARVDVADEICTHATYVSVCAVELRVRRVERERKADDHCCCRKPPPPQSRHTCTSRTRSPRRKRRNGSAAGSDSSCSWDHRRGSGISWGGGSFESRRA